MCDKVQVENFLIKETQKMRDHNFADAVAKSRESLIGWSTGRSNKSSLTLTCRICMNYLQIMKEDKLEGKPAVVRYTKKKGCVSGTVDHICATAIARSRKISIANAHTEIVSFPCPWENGKLPKELKQFLTCHNLSIRNKGRLQNQTIIRCTCRHCKSNAMFLRFPQYAVLVKFVRHSQECKRKPKKSSATQNEKSGRRTKSLIPIERQQLYWNWILPPTCPKRKRLDKMKIDFGFLTEDETTFANGIVKERGRKYDGRILLKLNGEAKAFELSKKHKHLLSTVLRRACPGMEIYVPGPTSVDRGWLLETQGSCDFHVDHEDKAFFSLLICLHTNACYEMNFSGNVKTAEDNPSSWRKVIMQTCSYLLFPACALHKCVSDEENERVILNILFKRTIKKRKK